MMIKDFVHDVQKDERKMIRNEPEIYLDNKNDKYFGKYEKVIFQKNNRNKKILLIYLPEQVDL